MNLNKLIKLPDLVTLAGTICGILSIFLSVQRDLIFAALFLALAVLFDGLDGTIARWTKRKGNFGKELDSLSDVVAFGVAPAVFGFRILSLNFTNIAILCFFVCAGILRLARFNVKGIKGYYEGLPITSSGIIIPLFYLLKLPYFNIVFLIMGILFISPFKIKKVF